MDAIGFGKSMILESVDMSSNSKMLGKYLDIFCFAKLSCKPICAIEK